MSNKPRGFAAMDKDALRNLASLGGVAVPAEKRTFSVNKKLASEAGVKGGKRGGIRVFHDKIVAANAGQKGARARELLVYMRRLAHQAACRALCLSGKFETGEGTCAGVCMDQLGDARAHPCTHVVEVHGKLATQILDAVEAKLKEPIPYEVRYGDDG